MPLAGENERRLMKEYDEFWGRADKLMHDLDEASRRLANVDDSYVGMSTLVRDVANELCSRLERLVTELERARTS
jgi:type II secretory pathway predicted ATPase ExeA